MVYNIIFEILFYHKGIEFYFFVAHSVMKDSGFT